MIALLQVEWEPIMSPLAARHWVQDKAHHEDLPYQACYMAEADHELTIVQAGAGVNMRFVETAIVQPSLREVSAHGWP